MGSNSNTKLATQQSIKSYVDAQNAAQAINFQGDTGGNQSVTINSEVMPSFCKAPETVNLPPTTPIEPVTVVGYAMISWQRAAM